MLPGFITLFKDIDGLVHLYFYKGYTENGRFYYNDLDLKKCNYNFDLKEYKDGAKEYIFENKNIKSITCKLVSFNNNEEVKILKIK